MFSQGPITLHWRGYGVVQRGAGVVPAVLFFQVISARAEFEESTELIAIGVLSVT